MEEIRESFGEVQRFGAIFERRGLFYFKGTNWRLEEDETSKIKNLILMERVNLLMELDKFFKILNIHFNVSSMDSSMDAQNSLELIVVVKKVDGHPRFFLKVRTRNVLELNESFRFVYYIRFLVEYFLSSIHFKIGCFYP